MQIGDKRKATVLVIVAIAALAFLVIRLMPSEPGKVKVATDRVASAPPVSANKPLPLILITDPFSHPSLAREGVEPITKPAVKQPPTIRGGLPGVVPNDASTGGGSDDTDSSAIRPQDPGSGNQPFDLGQGKISSSSKIGQPFGQTLQLTAIMRVDRFQAIIKVNDKAQVFEVGAQIAKGVSVKAITADDVVLSINGRKKTLKPGGKTKL